MDPRIVQRLVEIGVSPLEVLKVIEEVKDEPSEEHIYEVLKKINPEAAEIFRKEMNLSVWRSDLRKEPFNRDRIVQSLIREANIPRSLADKISKEIEERIRESNLTFLTSSLIRELALIKLIEYGMEDAYKRYARLGIPVHDLLKMENLHPSEIGKRILTQYTILYLLPHKLRDALFEGYVTIGGIENPFVHYATAYVMKTSQEERWVNGLFQYLKEGSFVAEPSIYIPPFEDIKILLSPLKKIYNATLWSDYQIEGVITSDIPVYSFGKVSDRKILDLIIINVEKMYLNMSKASVDEYMESLLFSIEEYEKHKKELVKGGTLYLKIIGDYPIEGFRVLRDGKEADSE